MVKFPDYSDGEEIIRTVGKAELLYKHGKKILRFNKIQWNSDNDKENYAAVKDIMKGRVLNIGLGNGLSAQMILDTEITELISYESEQDITDMYNARVEDIEDEDFKSDVRHIITTKDAIVDKPTGNFDVIYYEICMDSPTTYDDAKRYIQWALTKLNRNGFILLNFSNYSNALVSELGLTSTQITRTEGRVTQPKFIKITN